VEWQWPAPTCDKTHPWSSLQWRLQIPMTGETISLWYSKIRYTVMLHSAAFGVRCVTVSIALGRQTPLGCGLNAAEAVDYEGWGTPDDASLMWIDTGKGLMRQQIKSQVEVAHPPQGNQDSQLITCSGDGHTGLAPPPCIDKVQSIGKMCPLSGRVYHRRLGDSVCSALIARWTVLSLVDSLYRTDLKCAVPRVWIDAVQSRFWPGRDAEGCTMGLAASASLHCQQIKRCVIEGNKRLEDESIDTQAIKQ
jgi:hypothetical protein